MSDQIKVKTMIAMTIATMCGVMGTKDKHMIGIESPREWSRDHLWDRCVDSLEELSIGVVKAFLFIGGTEVDLFDDGFSTFMDDSHWRRDEMDFRAVVVTSAQFNWSPNEPIVQTLHQNRDKRRKWRSLYAYYYVIYSQFGTQSLTYAITPYDSMQHMGVTVSTYTMTHSHCQVWRDRGLYLGITVT